MYVCVLKNRAEKLFCAAIGHRKRVLDYKRVLLDHLDGSRVTMRMVKH